MPHYKVWILFFCISHPAISVFSQHTGAFTKCEYSYFSKSKTISTSICFNDANTWGEAKAFNRQGKEIYRRSLRKVGGHAYVRFTYYPSGSAKEAYFSDAPDAGIQWYHETIYFNEEGIIVDEKKESHEDLRSPSKFLLETEKPIVVKKVEPSKVDTPKLIKGADTYANEIWIYNRSNKTLIVNAVPLKKEVIPNSITVKKGEKKRLTVFGNGYSEQLPEDYFTLRSSEKKGTKNKLKTASFIIKFKSKTQGTRLSQFEYWIE